MRILLADDHNLIRDALGALMMNSNPDLEVIPACDLDQAIRTVKAADPFDVILLDFCMPGMNGLNGAETMLKVAENTPVMLMSGYASIANVQLALRMGLRGFLPKTLAGRSLVNAVRLVASGEMYVPMEYMVSENDTQPEGISLTTREYDVLYELRRGFSNKEIARSLNIAETTVKLHLRTLSTKLEARNRTDIVIRAIDAGLA